jgi:hypothetical protein
MIFGFSSVGMLLVSLAVLTGVDAGTVLEVSGEADV